MGSSTVCTNSPDARQQTLQTISTQKLGLPGRTSLQDVDFLGLAEPMLATFREICAIQVDDGVAFDVSALRVELIREALDYGGLRLRTIAQLAGARITVVIDIGFGDAIEPGIEEISLPVLLDLPEPRLRVYARETVIAEKFQAMVMLGLVNSRMKDFYDVWILSRTYDFDADRLSRAIAATFDRRGTAVPLDEPDALTQAFASDAAKQRQWTAFARDVAIGSADDRQWPTVAGRSISSRRPYFWHVF